MTHSAPEFAALTPKELLNRLVLEEDRVPLELIDACAAHGEAMVEVLREAIGDEYTWSDELPDIWWVPLHAAFILGRIPSESAGLLLVYLMRRTHSSLAGDDGAGRTTTPGRKRLRFCRHVYHGRCGRRARAQYRQA